MTDTNPIAQFATTSIDRQTLAQETYTLYEEVCDVAHLGVLFECLPIEHTFCSCVYLWCVIAAHAWCAKVAQLCVLYFHFQVPFHFRFHLDSE